jgi:RNA polymerase sigma-70 factor (ECF subfamily)
MNAAIDIAIEVASRCATSLIATGSFRSDDREDLKQDILADLIRREGRFDTARGDWPGFVWGVARHRSWVLIRHRRRRTWEVLAGDMKRGDDVDGDPMEAFEDRRRTHTVAALHLRIDVQQVVANLHPRLRCVAVLLSQMPVAEVCQHTGKSRSTVHRMTVEIRGAFLAAGFEPGRRRSSSSCIADRHPPSAGLTPTPIERTTL